MKSIASLLSIIALGAGLLSCSGGGGGGGGGGGTPATPTTAANFGVVGNSYFSLLSTNTLTPPVTWTVLGGIPLPAGLALTSATGAVSGIPTIAENSTVTFRATDSTGKTETISVLFAIHPRTDPVSIDNSTPPVPGGSSSIPSISADGRFVAFASSATLIPGVGGTQIYIHDWQTNQTSLVSRNDVGTAGNGASSQPTISSNGRFVAFTSASSNLTTDLTPALSQIFLRDTQLNITTLVSQATGLAVAVGGGASSQPTISSNGRFVAFTSTSSNLTTDLNPALSQIFLRDTQLNTTTLVSQATGVAVAVGGGASSQPTISGDGQFVAFTSASVNLTTDPDPAPTQIFLRDTQLNTTTLVSQATGVTVAVGGGASSQPTISSNGRFVAFTSASVNLTTDLNPALSQIFLRDTVGNGTSLVSKDNSSPSVPGNGLSNTPSVSGNGGFVAFSSVSTNLGATGGGNQIYVRALP